MVYMERPPKEFDAGQPDIEPDELELKADTPVEMFFEDARVMAEAVIKARKTLKEYLQKEPKLQKVLDTPQSSDKHAEGSRIAEHYQSILVSLELLENGFMDFDRASRGMDLEGFHEQWDATLEFINENREFMLTFAICHDLAKPDCLGIYAKDEKGLKLGFPGKRDFHKKNRDMSPKERDDWRNKYLELYEDFAMQHPDIKDDAKMQKAFFEEYGLSTTYVGHENITPENRAIIDRMCAEQGLSQEDEDLLIFSIQQHVSAYLSFEKGPADYAALVRLSREAGVDVRRAILSIQAGMLIDGIFGVRKWNDAGTGFMIATKAIKDFWQAERDYPEYEKEQAHKAAEQAILLRLRDVAAQTGLRGNDLIALGINPKLGMQKIIEVIYAAIRHDADLDRAALSAFGLTEDVIDKLAVKTDNAKEVYRELVANSNPFKT